MQRLQGWDRNLWLLSAPLELLKGLCLCLKSCRQHLSKKCVKGLFF